MMYAPDSPVGERRPTDVKFIVVTQDGRERTYVAEKKKLASASRVFSDMFENEQSVIIQDFSAKAFKVMLRHVYKKQYCLDNWDLSLEVFRVAEKYRMFSLRDECEEFFSRTPIRSSNALHIYKIASRYNIQKVLALCEEVFENDSDVLLTPDFIYAEKGTVKKIIRHKSELQPEQMGALINWGRYECHRRKIPVNRENLEKCVISVCGTSLAISVSKAIEKLDSKRKADINANIDAQKSVSYMALVPLSNSVSGTILDSFNMDIICEVKISVFNCTLEFTGVELHLKKSCLEESSLEIFYSAENLSENVSISDTKVGDAMGFERKEITFSQGLIVKSGQIANITVGIEELPMSQCLQNSKVEQEFINRTKGIHFKLEFRSNQASRVHQGPFFIEKLFYKSLPPLQQR